MIPSLDEMRQAAPAAIATLPDPKLRVIAITAWRLAEGKTPAEIAAYLRDMKIRTLFLRSRTEHFAALDEIAMMLDTGDPDVIAVGRWLETARRTRGAQGR
jgi:hypothetical protein